MYITAQGPVSERTYTVSSGTLNPTVLYHTFVTRVWRTLKVVPYSIQVVVVVSVVVVYLYSASHSASNASVWYWELIPVLDSQSAGDQSHKPGGRLPLLSARPAVPPQPPRITVPWLVPNYTAWWQRHMRVNNLPRVAYGIWTCSVDRKSVFLTATCRTLEGPKPSASTLPVWCLSCKKSRERPVWARSCVYLWLRISSWVKEKHIDRWAVSCWWMANKPVHLCQIQYPVLKLL